MIQEKLPPPMTQGGFQEKVTSQLTPSGRLSRMRRQRVSVKGLEKREPVVCM